MVKSSKSRRVVQPYSDVRLVGYARVSTTEQNLDLQIAALKAAGVRDDNLWTDMASGVSRKRQGLDFALADARKGDTFIVWKLDRLGRSIADLLKWMQHFKEAEVGFRSLTEGIDTTTPGGRLVLHVLAALAEFERDLIVERTRAGMAAAKAKGKKIAPDRKIDAKQIAEARKLIASGAKVRHIAARYGVSTQTIYTRIPRAEMAQLRIDAAARAKRKP